MIVSGNHHCAGHTVTSRHRSKKRQRLHALKTQWLWQDSQVTQIALLSPTTTTLPQQLPGTQAHALALLSNNRTRLHVSITLWLQSTKLMTILGRKMTWLARQSWLSRLTQARPVCISLQVVSLLIYTVERQAQITSLICSVYQKACQRVLLRHSMTELFERSTTGWTVGRLIIVTRYA